MPRPLTLGRTALLALVPLVLPLAGCIKQPGVVKAPSPMDAAVVGVLDPQDGGPVAGLPDRVTERVSRALTARDLTPAPVPTAQLAEAFSSRRVTKQRVAWLADGNNDAPLVVLVEAEALYYSQIEGRNRWTVNVTATVADPDAPESGLTSSFEVPVILQFVHEKEPRALEEAAPIIERQVGHLLDQYLGALPAGG